MNIKVIASKIAAPAITTRSYAPIRTPESEARKDAELANANSRNDIELMRVSHANAIRAATNGGKVYFAPYAVTENRLILRANKRAFHKASNPLAIYVDGDYYIAKLDYPTREYLAHGQWNPHARKRVALCAAPECKLDERDILRNSELAFTDETPNMDAAQRAHYGAFSLFLHDEDIVTGQNPVAILSSLATSHNFKLTDCGEFQPGVRKILFGKYAIYLPLNAA